MKKPRAGRSANQVMMDAMAINAADNMAILGGDANSALPPLQSVADRALIRLEVLRLAHRHDHTPEQIVERCKALEAYVIDDQPADKF